MSRIPAREAVVASSTVSVFVSLCLFVGVAGGLTPHVPADSASAAAARPGADVGSTYASDDVVTAETGSHQGVSFDASQLAGSPFANMLGMLGVAGAPGTLATGTQASAPTTAWQALPVARAAAVVAPPAPASANSTPSTGSETSTPSSAGTASSAPREQSRSSELAAVSGKPRDIARALSASRGWTGAQWTCLDQLWEHESKFETTVRNSRSGAYGIPQALPASKMASVGADWRSNPVTQIRWGLAYIADRYDTPCGAWSHWKRANSY